MSKEVINNNDTAADEPEYLDAYADLAAAYNANNMVAEMDETLLSANDARRVEGIRKMSLRIAYSCLKEIYGYRFGE